MKASETARLAAAVLLLDRIMSNPGPGIPANAHALDILTTTIRYLGECASARLHRSF